MTADVISPTATPTSHKKNVWDSLPMELKLNILEDVLYFDIGARDIWTVPGVRRIKKYMKRVKNLRRVSKKTMNGAVEKVVEKVAKEVNIDVVMMAPGVGPPKPDPRTQWVDYIDFRVRDEHSRCDYIADGQLPYFWKAFRNLYRVLGKKWKWL